MSLLAPLVAAFLAAAPPAVIVREADVARQEVPPHQGVGMSTAYRMSDAAPGRNFEFRKRVLHPGASIGLHVLSHDEVYYVMSGTGVVTSDGREYPVEAGTAAYLYEGADVGIRQTGAEPLVLIIAYPLKERVK
ncbi:MAG: cupin 2, conserved barrel [Caulobacter sp.]|jgi:mannose-6-phosphate isomerase-like protein (cupin superfamily)|nr:cupin 2, conserved barrel [Caulobacter sp.]